MQRSLLNVCKRVLNNACKCVLRNCSAVFGSVKSGFGSLHNSRAFKSRNLNYLAAELTRKFGGVDFIAVFLNNIHHIYGNNNGNTELCKLCCEVKVTLKVCAVNDVKNCVGAFLNKVVSCDNLFKGVGRE